MPNLGEARPFSQAPHPLGQGLASEGPRCSWERRQSGGTVRLSASPGVPAARTGRVGPGAHGAQASGTEAQGRTRPPAAGTPPPAWRTEAPLGPVAQQPQSGDRAAWVGGRVTKPGPPCRVRALLDHQSLRPQRGQAPGCLSESHVLDGVSHQACPRGAHSPGTAPSAAPLGTREDKPLAGPGPSKHLRRQAGTGRGRPRTH